jgi:hypothetical protein
MSANNYQAKLSASLSTGIFRTAWMMTLVACATFGAGFAFHKFQYFPYKQVLRLARKINFGNQPIPLEILARQYSRDRENIPSDRKVDTGLLPIDVKAVRVSDHVSIPKTGGAITTVGDHVLVL